MSIEQIKTMGAAPIQPGATVKVAEQRRAAFLVQVKSDARLTAQDRSNFTLHIGELIAAGVTVEEMGELIDYVVGDFDSMRMPHGKELKFGNSDRNFASSGRTFRASIGHGYSEGMNSGYMLFALFVDNQMVFGDYRWD